MEQHPIPQAITTYEFRLVGEMTLKQFGKLALGLGLAFIFYLSPLPSYLKWPLVLLFAGLGVALAFIPIEGRPLETWIISFLKAVYSPTEYVFQKEPELPEFLQETPPVKPPQPATVSLKTKPRQTRLKEYLGTLPVAQKTTAWEQAEKQFLAQVKAAFEKIPAPTPVKPKPKPVSSPIVAPVLAQKAPPSFTPKKPNIIAGIIKDKQDRLVEGALVEIKDRQGFPVRALKSNSLGQFQIASPLENGVYTIRVEKPGLKFAIIKIKLEGKIVKPLAIKAK